MIRFKIRRQFGRGISVPCGVAIFSRSDNVATIPQNESTIGSGARPLVNERDRGLALLHDQSADYRLVSVPEMEPSERERVARAPQTPLKDASAKIVKQGRSALIVRSPLRASNREIWTAYKRCGSKTWVRRLARGLQPARTIRNFHFGHRLLSHGIPTARPLLAVAPRWHALFKPAFLATEWLEGATPIDAFLRRTMTVEPLRGREAVLRETAERIGQLVGTLHARGFAHRDLKATNLLVREEADRIQVFVIDLDGASRPWFLTRRTRMNNLARLVAATAESPGMCQSLRRRALAAYLAGAGDAMPWKNVWRRLAEISRIRRSRKARHSS
jgi:tRNA A-37 threonylcarbamoyl transferase component Bud32